MLSAIRDFFTAHLGGALAPADDESALRLATAVLLVQVMKADHEVTPEERAEVLAVVSANFELSDELAEEVVALAERETDNSISVHPFTSVLNEELTLPQKIEMVELMWRVVFADGHKDATEEAVVRSVSRLLHVPHRDFVGARRRVQKALIDTA
jgi:uncharacterized tellurite resistance protein B-like protein